MASQSEQLAAEQLWSQIFDRLATDEYAAIVDPNYDPSEDSAKFKRAMSKASWADEQIGRKLEIEKTLLANAPVTSAESR